MQTHPQTPSLQDLLFYGSSNQIINLLPTPSQYFSYSPSDLLQTESPESLLQALIPRFPYDFLGQSYKSLYLPCTPAHEILLKPPLYSLPSCLTPERTDILSHGFIKTSEKTGFQGYHSGKRSAIYYDKTNGKFYRLKGCGNEENGFIKSLGKVNLNPDSQEIRGCHYKHTVKRELLMTEKIDSFLKDFGFQSANRSIGFWLYPENIGDIDKSLSNEFPKIQKYCGIFETLGEKRVATHLFQGFEALLAEIIRFQEKIKGFSMNLDEVFPKDRVLKDGSFIATPVNMEESSEPEPLIDILGFISDKKIICPLINQNEIPGFLAEIIENLAIKPLYIQLFSEIFLDLCQESPEILLTDFFGISAVLFARIGFEIGRIKRIFQAKSLNWGYYFDHHPYLAHCNAHPNNFAILPENAFFENILAPLDFDLAFEEHEFINISYEDKTYGEFDKEVFKAFMEQERISLELAFTGMENMDNFQYYGLNLKELDKEKTRLFNGIKILLRDLLRKYYLIGMQEKAEFGISGFQWKKQKKIYDLIKLSLIITNDCLG